MHDSFEFTHDPERAELAAGCTVTLCQVKWEAAKAAMNVLRQVASSELVHYARADARHAVAVLDQVGLTPDFEPSKVP